MTDPTPQPPTAPITPTEFYALLIGVNTYEADSRRNLRAPRNDVLSWFKLLRRLGVPAENIQVVTSPALTPEELDVDGVTCREARTDGVQAALELFRQQTAADHAYGLVFLSGHGDFSMSEGYSLFLSDCPAIPTALDFTHRGVTNGRLSAFHIPGDHGSPRVTVLADVCRPSALMAPETTGGPPQDLDSMSLFGVGAVFSAAGAREDAYERCYEGLWHGEFTWAAMVILRNWPVAPLPGGRGSHVQISLGTLCDRMVQLLEVFNGPGSKETPTVFLGCDRDAPFLFPGRSLRTAEFAVNAPSHEFQPGTSDFWFQDRPSPTPATWGPKVVFGKVVVTSQGAATYSFSFTTNSATDGFRDTVSGPNRVWGVEFKPNGTSYSPPPNTLVTWYAYTYTATSTDLAGNQATERFFGWYSPTAQVGFFTDSNTTMTFQFWAQTPTVVNGKRYMPDFTVGYTVGSEGRYDWHTPAQASNWWRRDEVLTKS